VSEINFDEILYLRDEEVEGIGPWWWVKSDTGAWNGPSKEFAGLKTLFRRHCRQRRTMVQAGGCLGMYPRLWGSHFDEVYTFEIDPLNYECLLRNCAPLILLDRIRPYHAALGDSNDPVWVNVNCMTNVGMHQALRFEPMSEWPKVPQMRLDDFTFEHLDAIQLDVETYECYVLEGARETIRKHKPVISVETTDAAVRIFMAGEGYVEVDRNVSDSVWVHEKHK
jgi:FkbM family methyltransferase